jgi:protein-tyrosine phosphatase
MQETISAQGLVDVEVVYNIRNMGHCRIVNGQSFCSEIYRSATLGGLTEAGVLQLAELGITTIVDLRSSNELEIRPTRDVSAANIRTIHAPVVEYDGSPTSPEDFQGYAHRYRELLVLGMSSYRLLFETVAANDGGVLFHCAAGKDRTGVAAALLLLFAGVADEEIIEDYSRSSGLLEPLFEQWRPRFTEDGVSEGVARRLMGSHPDDMSATLEHIRQQWGGAEGYMSAIGMSPEALALLRSRLTVA